MDALSDSLGPGLLGLSGALLSFALACFTIAAILLASIVSL